MNSAPQKLGTKDLGREYELIMAARATLLLLLDRNIANFTIRTNDDSYGKFDDVVMSVIFQDGTEQTIAAQLKHKENVKKSLQAVSVEASKGDFSIESYYESYQTEIRDELKEGCQFVLHTNVPFTGQQNLKKFEASSCVSCPGGFLLRTKEQGKMYSFQEKEGSAYGAMSRFLQSFSLYCNQASLEELQESTKHKFMDSLKCGEECWLKYLNFHRALFNGNYAPPTLSRDEIVFQIMYFTLCNFVVEFKEKHEASRTFVKQLASSCDIVVVPNCRELVTKRKVNENELVNEDLVRQIKESKLLKTSTEMRNVTKEDEFRLCWYLGHEPPLIALDAGSTESALTMIERLFDRPTKRHKFVLIADIPRPKFRHLSVIRDLSDIKRKNETLYLEEILKYNITLQGRSNIPLGELFDILKDDDLNGLFTVHGALRVRQGLLAIGKSICPRLVESYIERIILQEAVNINIVKAEVLRQSLIILTGFPQFAEAEVEFVTIGDFLEQNGKISAAQVIVEENLHVALKWFEDICKHLVENSDKRNVYLFKNIDDRRLELVRSCGSIEILHEFLLCDEETRITENDAVAMVLEKGTVVVCAKPGIGKTVFIGRFAAQCPADFWVVQVTLREHINFFKNLPESDEDILRYFIGTSYETGDLISEAVSAKFKHCGKVIFLLDGVDELPSECVNPALQCMKVLSKSGFRQVVTSRNNLKQVLEEHLELLSVDLAEIGVGDQDLYIEKRLEKKFSKADIEKRVAGIHNNRTIVKNNDVLGVPLQLYMLTEIMLSSEKKAQVVDEADFFVLTNMYEQFFVGKFEHFQVKTGFDPEKVLPYISDTTAHRAKMYQIAALTSCLDAEHLTTIESSLGSYFAESYKEECNTFFNQFIKEGDPFGVIDRLVDGSAVYAHQTFAEYFTAVFLSKNCSRCFQLQEFIFEEKYDNVRLMFDMLLAKRCPGHIAVLYKDLEKFRSLPEQAVIMRDEGGRNALHLFSSWGEKYNFREIEIRQEATGIVYCSFDQTVRYRPVDRHISKENKTNPFVQGLVKMFGCTEVDKLYGWTAASYAEKTMSLSILNHIAGTGRISVEALRESAHKYTILVYSIIYNFWNLFYIMDVPELPLITGNRTLGYTLLDLATEYATTKYIEPLLENRVYKTRITGRTVRLAITRNKFDIVKLLLEKSTSTILSQADYDGLFVRIQIDVLDKDMIDLLLSKGANIDSMDSARQTGLLRFCKEGNLEAVRYLLEKGADIAATNWENEDALILASRAGNAELVRFLFEHGSFDPLQKNTNGDSALCTAISKGHLEVVKYFVNEKTCNLRTLADNRKYLLHFAVCYNRPEIEAFLVDALPANENFAEKAKNACVVL